MNITKKSLHNPAGLAVVLILITLFGVFSIKDRPIQLLPNISPPQITIYNNWREAAPEEMESNIIEPQESILKHTLGLEEIESDISRGFGQTTLTFNNKTDMQQALVDVINNLNQAPSLPADAEEPLIVVGGRGQPSVASLQIYPKKGFPIPDYTSDEYEDLFNNVIETRLARISGVGRVNMQSRRPFEIRINIDTYLSASLGVSISDISQAISQARDVSAGFADLGRRQYTVRFLGQYDIDQLGELIISWNENRPIYLSEIAKIEKLPIKNFGFSKRNGYSSYYIWLQGSSDSNAVEILDALNEAIIELNHEVLNDAGLVMELSYDASLYIRRAINLVKNNLGLGVFLALSTLWFFLRDTKSTLIIATSIPVSLMVSFGALKIFDLSLNVISLAGLAFSVGLILDAAIIVQENIVRNMQKGNSLSKPIETATLEVRGALLASTITTIAIFLPILFLEGAEAQMFSDLALTLSISVFASLITALTVIPVASKKWLNQMEKSDPLKNWWVAITSVVMSLTKTKKKRYFWITSLMSASIYLVFLLLPKADFLPTAKADVVQVFFNAPAGATTDVYENEIAKQIIERLKPYMEHKKKPYIKGYNLSLFGSNGSIYLYPENPKDVEEFIDLFRNSLMHGIPGTQAYTSRASLLNVGNNGGRSLRMNFQGKNISELMKVARKSITILENHLIDATIRPLSALTLSEPELEIHPNEYRITETGLNLRDVATAIRAYTGGLYVGEYFDGNSRYNMTLTTDRWSNPDELAGLPISTPLAGTQSIGSLTSIQRTVGPNQLFRSNGQRTISLEILPADHMTIEETLNILRYEVNPKIQKTLPNGVSIQFKGSADRLESALNKMLLNFLLAVFILYLIMAVIFKSLKDSLLILFLIPIALAGGFVALKALNLFIYQSFDMLTMIGLIILLGLVVNNAILFVSHTRNAEALGVLRADAVANAIRVRAKPIFMSTLTSIIGMLPLLLVPGVGSDIYRGLAVVIIGGMLFSMIFTLILMPSLLRIGESTELIFVQNTKFNTQKNQKIYE